MNESCQFIESTQFGEITTFLPGSQLRVSMTRYRTSQVSSSIKKSSTCPISPSDALMEYPATSRKLRRFRSSRLFLSSAASISRLTVLSSACPTGPGYGPTLQRTGPGGQYLGAPEASKSLFSCCCEIG